MASRLERRQRQIEKNILSRFDDDLRQMAGDIGRIVLSYATSRDANGNPIVPISRTLRDRLQLQVWGQVIKPYFVGSGEAPLIGNVPQSPFMRLMVDGIEQCIRNSVQAQVAMLRKYAPDDVYQWLTGRRAFGADIVEMYPHSPLSPNPFPLSEGARGVISEQGGKGKGFKGYDPFHLFVDPNGYRLSDNGWKSALEVRRAIDALLDLHISQGTSAVKIADMLVKYLVPSARGVVTRTPYGSVGSYWARRLARTEITAAAGRATINMAIANPFVEKIDWRLSASHPRMDICDNLAASGPYDPRNVPSYVPHPHCLCTLVPIVVEDREAVIAAIRDSIYNPSPDNPYAPLQGAFNEDWLVSALMSGLFLVILERMFNDVSPTI